MAKQPGRQLIRCDTCGRTVECSPQDLLGYVKTKWPQCCGQTMTYFVEAEPPPHDSALETQLPDEPS